MFTRKPSDPSFSSAVPMRAEIDSADISSWLDLATARRDVQLPVRRPPVDSPASELPLGESGFRFSASPEPVYLPRHRADVAVDSESAVA